MSCPRKSHLVAEQPRSGDMRKGPIILTVAVIAACVAGLAAKRFDAANLFGAETQCRPPPIRRRCRLSPERW